jgi:hypothetical protein
VQYFYQYPSFVDLLFFRWIYVTSSRLPGLLLPISLKKDYNYIDALSATEITLSYNRYLFSVNKNEHYGNNIAHNVCGKTIKAGARAGEYAVTSVRKRVDKGLKVVYIILSRTHIINLGINPGSICKSVGWMESLS